MKNPYQLFFLTLFAMTGFVFSVISFQLGGDFHEIRNLSLYKFLFGINIATFMLLLIDKQNARAQRTRVPEMVLFTSTVLGGGIGMLVGMKVLHHKTSKASFQLAIFSILALQVGLFIMFFKS